MKNFITAQLYNGIAKRIWEDFDRIDAMPTRTIDELCAKEKEIAKARKKFEAMPKRVQDAVLNIRKSELV